MLSVAGLVRACGGAGGNHSNAGCAPHERNGHLYSGVASRVQNLVRGNFVDDRVVAMCEHTRPPRADNLPTTYCGGDLRRSASRQLGTWAYARIIGTWQAARQLV